MRVLVTGATGNVGGPTVAALRARGAEVVAAGLQAREGVVRFDFSEQETWEVARGCEALMLIRPPAVSDTKRTLIPFVERARGLGVRKVVFLSVQGADQSRLVPHHAVDVHLRSNPGRWTILQPGFFAQNIGDAYRRDIAEEGRLYVPAGSGRVAWVDVRDLAEVAADALLGAHDGLAPVLTGPEAFDFTQAAEMLTAALGRPIRYEPASLWGYVRHLRRRQMPWMQVAVQSVLHVRLRGDRAAEVDPTLGQLLGRRPRSLLDYIRDVTPALFGARPSM